MRRGALKQKSQEGETIKREKQSSRRTNWRDNQSNRQINNQLEKNQTKQNGTKPNQQIVSALY
jgi:hypothetical protein